MTYFLYFCAVKDLFFPYCCPSCGHVTSPERVLCQDCLASLPRTEQCWQRGNITEEIFAHDKYFERGAAFMFFEKDNPVQNLVHRMKYGLFANPRIGYALAREAAAEFMQSDFFNGIDIILPVPLHPKRFRERGFNQSEWICRGLTDVTKIPTDTTHLIRILNNDQQALAAGNDRQKNVKDIFAVVNPRDLYRKHILLVDDVITSGSTLLACMDALKSVRGRRISVFALGKVR